MGFRGSFSKFEWSVGRFHDPLRGFWFQGYLRRFSDSLSGFWRPLREFLGSMPKIQGSLRWVQGV